MRPIEFPEQTKILQKPKDMTDEECQPMAVWSDGKQCISCWVGNWKERLKFLFSGRIYLSVITGMSTQPPVWVNPFSPFEPELGNDYKWKEDETSNS